MQKKSTWRWLPVCIFLGVAILTAACGTQTQEQPALPGDQTNDGNDFHGNNLKETRDDSDSNDLRSGEPQEKVAAYTNEHFRIYVPQEEVIVGSSFQVEGQVRGHSGHMSYVVEDGHFELDKEEIALAEEGQEWTDFSFTVVLDHAPSQTQGTLLLYQKDIADMQDEPLIVPIRFDPKIVQYLSEGNTGEATQPNTD